MPVPPFDTNQIVVTASRVAEASASTPASVTVLDQALIEHLGQALVPDLLRLIPSTSVSVSGPAGSLTEVRIRGAEANHTLLFIDGIRANDPATGDQPRFDLLNADVTSRIEVVRGPQSALWGSDAVGGVVAVNGAPVADSEYTAALEAGSLGFERASGSVSRTSGKETFAAAVGWQGATGIDSFDGTGDKDGYRNLSARFHGTYATSPNVRLGAAGFALKGRSEFDGFDPATFLHADTLDNSRNRMAAGRLWVDVGSPAMAWSGRVGASLLGSSNRNYLADDFLNRTSGIRRSLDAQLEHRFATGALEQTVIAAAETEHEGFHARDTLYGGASNQDRSRDHHSLTVEWRAKANAVTGDIAVRRDMFNRFADATTLRASLLARLGGGFTMTGGYAEGIAQPTFFDLYGFFPGSFVGTSTLKPESSRGLEASVRLERGTVQASLTGYRQRLHHEIIDVFDPTTFLSSTANRDGSSHRSGIEAEVHWRAGAVLRVSGNYAYLNATEPDAVAAPQVREVRRPKHSGSITVDGSRGMFSYGASVAYTGARSDMNFDVFPGRTVSLHAYWLADACVAYRIVPHVQIFARAANALDAHYQDAFGYRTQGRSVYAGIRLAGG
ncbi:TonB-dependent receptor domain-containing protein [Sphingomonas sp. F9_3S_D5_B_2]